MYVQSQIYSQLTSAQGIEQVQILLSSNEFESHSAVGRAVCEKFGFRDARGRFQISGCLKALRRLKQSGAVRLPASRGGGTVAIASVRCCLIHLLSAFPRNLLLSRRQLDLCRPNQRTRHKCSVSTKPTLPTKDIWLYPLCRDFRQILNS